MTDDPLTSEGASPAGPTFEAAVRNAVEGLQESIAEFESLLAAVPESAYSPAEWGIIEKSAADLETLVEQVELEYTMAAYDSAAWYEIMKDLPRVTRMLGDTMLLMRDAQARVTQAEP
jgi:hypothetical protein